MLKFKNKTKSNLIKLCAFFVFPFSLFGGLSLKQSATAESSASSNYVTSYEEKVSVSNSSFTEGGSTIAQGNSFTGWEAIETSSSAKGMLIDVGTGTNTDENGENVTFSKYQSTYMLEANPGAKGSDSRIMMINSKSKESDKNQNARKGYKSSSITLSANSYYRFNVSVKTALNGDDNVNASVYISGLVDKDGQTFRIGYENITTSIWKEYYIYIATGNQEQTITIDLYLGSANGAVSSGAVFFDEVYLNKYSENAFFELCSYDNYEGQDTYKSFSSETCFLINDLQEDKALIDYSGYNFDFENEISDLGIDSWNISRSSYGHALVKNMTTMQSVDFANMTGYGFVGNDLSYNNLQSLILYTDEEGGYVNVTSKDVEIKAHAVYKVTLKMKVAGMDEGSFYLQVKENETIYSLYPELLSSNEEDGNYYSLNSGKTTGYTSNTENKFTNDYQTISFFIKGHSLYDSSVNLNLCLGDSETNAIGCVVIDDIQIEYSTYENYSSATDKLELTTISTTPTGIENSYFNSTEISENQLINKTEENEADISYPLPATSWTATKEDEDINQQGVIYLYNSESYKKLYNGKYIWADTYPGHPTNTTNVDLPNNVYMMYNEKNSYQSVTSASYTLDGGSVYKLNFDYFTIDKVTAQEKAKIKVEIIDGNGITIFTKSNISSLQWANMEIYFQTANAVSTSIQIKISLGDEENKVGGIVYLDNFIVTKLTSTEEGADNTSAYEKFEKADNKVDLTDYYLSISSNGEVSNEITSTPAYNLTVDEVYDENETNNSSNCAQSGIVSGKENPFVYDFENLSIEDSNYLVLKSVYASKASLKSAYTMSLTADSYYKFSFDLATMFGVDEDYKGTDEHKCKYGVTVTIEGFDSVERLMTANELKHFSLYFKCTSNTNPTITFTLVSDCNETLGTALITRINLETITETDFNNAKLSNNYDKTVFTISQTSSTEDEDTDDGNTDDNTNTDENNNNTTNPLLMVSSILMGLALIVAILGYILKHVKIKKIEKIKKVSYDKKIAINHDAILVEAQKVRDQEFDKLKQAKEILENEKKQIELNHKKFIESERLQSEGKITRRMETAFKQYNYDINKINQKIDIIKEKLDYTMSAEYLLTIERNIVAQKEEKFYQDKRNYKAQVKKEIKKNKQEEKLNKRNKKQ